MNVSTARTESLCYIDPRSAAAGESVQHDYSLEITDESAKNYLQWIADRVTPHLGSSVLEVGAGHGAVTARVERGRHILAVDSSPPCLAAMQVRFAELENVRVELVDA